MNSFYADSDSSIDFDPMLDLDAQEGESQAISDLRSQFLCTVEHE